MEVSLAPPIIGSIGGLSITNTMFSAVATGALLIVFALIMNRKWSLIPGRTQVIFEALIELLMDKMTTIMGSEKRARRFFPLFFTFFIFLIIANNFTWIPFIESVVTADGVKIFNNPSAHYSLPIAMALVTLILSHLLAFFNSPLRHIGNFIKIAPIFQAISKGQFKALPMAFLDFALGFLDIIGEVAKLVSLSTRLFGNIFAGGVIIMIITSITVYTQYLVPIPFMLLGLLSGVVQAFVFSILSVIYLSLTTGTESDERASQT